MKTLRDYIKMLQEAPQNPKIIALQKEIQGIQAEINKAKQKGDARAVKDYTVQLNGAQADLAKLTGQAAPAVAPGASAAYGNPQIARQGQQQQINKGQEELRVAQASGNQAAAQAAQAKIDQATTNKADITWADKDHAYGTTSGRNLTPSTGPVTPAAQAPKPVRTAPAIPPEQLKKYQQILNAEGYPAVADGLWGPATQKAVRDFQIANGLSADGQIGPQTKAALDSFGASPVQSNANKITTTVTPGDGSAPVTTVDRVTESIDRILELARK
jgi:peptidoglycan hydrolase-like protein with peptidoglycan-binding domain